MKLIVIFFLFLFGVNYLYSQDNLVPNSSFEQLKKCPDTEEDITNILYYWYNPTMQMPIICNSCANGKPPFFGSVSYFGMPNNAGGFQYALDSNGYATFAVEKSWSQREYLSIRLKDSLSKGSIYKISFYISCQDNNRYSADEIGLFFSKDSIYKNTPYFLDYEPQIKSEEGIPMDDTLNWVEIKGEFTAGGGENYITIGQFKRDSKTTWKIVNPNGTSNCFYYLDKVEVILLRDSIPPPKDPQYTLFPNPATDEIKIEFKDIEPNSVEIELYDIIGRRIMIKQSNIIGSKYQADIRFLASGIYAYRLRVDGEYMGDGKLIIVR